MTSFYCQLFDCLCEDRRAVSFETNVSRNGAPAKMDSKGNKRKRSQEDLELEAAVKCIQSQEDKNNSNGSLKTQTFTLMPGQFMAQPGFAAPVSISGKVALPMSFDKEQTTASDILKNIVLEKMQDQRMTHPKLPSNIGSLGNMVPMSSSSLKGGFMMPFPNTCAMPMGQDAGRKLVYVHPPAQPGEPPVPVRLGVGQGPRPRVGHTGTLNHEPNNMTMNNMPVQRFQLQNPINSSLMQMHSQQPGPSRYINVRPTGSRSHKPCPDIMPGIKIIVALDTLPGSLSYLFTCGCIKFKCTKCRKWNLLSQVTTV